MAKLLNSASFVKLPKVLIVDDNQTTAEALSRVLKRADFEPAVALSGPDALRVAATAPIDAAVVDIHLPGMSGLEVSQSLREQFGPGLPIVILSGDTSMSTLNALSLVGATHFFSKPVNASQLLKLLADSLGSAAAVATA